MTMKTASFSTTPMEGRISIARLAPRRHPAGYRICSKLAPGKWFNSVSEEEYRRLFAAEILAPLDPQAMWDTLHAMASPHEPILLCWEEPGAFCHRRLVASWFEERLGVEVPELLPAASAGPLTLSLPDRP
jgi:hypothetical protein